MSKYIGTLKSDEYNQFMGTQKPIAELSEVILKEQSLQQIINSIQTKIDPIHMKTWNNSKFKMSGEPHPQSVNFIKNKLISIVENLENKEKGEMESGKYLNNYEEMVDVLVLSLKILESYQK